jgi:pepsin A
MIEEEARWIAGEERSQDARYLSISSKQWEQLQKHHESVSQVQLDQFEDEEDGEKDEDDDEEIQDVQSDSRASDAQDTAQARSGVGLAETKSSFAPTALTEVSHSQYIGPIGVGSTAASSACEAASSLVHPNGKVQEQELGSSVAEGASSCRAPQSKVWVVFDTGSTNLWIASDLCENGPCTKQGRTRYNHTLSPTYRKPEVPVRLSVRFGTGRLEGPLAVDDFSIGPFHVRQQTFAMIQTQDGSVFDQVPFEGILGLAWPSMSANKVRPFFDTVIAEKVLPQNLFAFYFSPNSVTANALFWGGVDDAFYTGQLEYFPVVDPHYWALQLISFKIGTEEILKCEAEDCSTVPLPTADSDAHRKFPKAIVDTGTTFFTVESNMASAVLNRLKHEACAVITPESHPDVTFTLRNEQGKNVDFVLSSSQYMTSSGGGESAHCAPAFMQIDVPKLHGPAMLLGEAFLRYYFSVYDRQDGDPRRGRVGLAPAAHGDATLRRLRSLTADQPAFAEGHQ